MTLRMCCLINKSFVKFTIIFLLFSDVYAIKQLSTPLFGKQIHDAPQKNNLINKVALPLRHIDINNLASRISNSDHSTKLGLVFASWSINTFLFNKVQKANQSFKKKQLENYKKNISESDNTIPISESDNTIPISEEDVIQCQKDFGEFILHITNVYFEGGEFVDLVTNSLKDLYGYHEHDVLFKPTKSPINSFRTTYESAICYFVGSENINNSQINKYDDAGFAINGGYGWSNVVFNNHKISINGNNALAMGTYDFTCATTNEIISVEYTFGYKRCQDGKMRIFLHHSSIPYDKQEHSSKSIEPTHITRHIHIHNLRNVDTNIDNYKEEISDSIDRLRENLKYLK